LLDEGLINEAARNTAKHGLRPHVARVQLKAKARGLDGRGGRGCAKGRDVAALRRGWEEKKTKGRGSASPSGNGEKKGGTGDKRMEVSLQSSRTARPVPRGGNPFRGDTPGGYPGSRECRILKRERLTVPVPRA